MPTVAEAPMLEALRRERNRFVAFAFAASDLVLDQSRHFGAACASGPAKLKYAGGQWVGG